MTAASADATIREGGALTVLLIEDHDDTREMLGKVLRKLGHRTVSVADCVEARALTVDRESIDLVLGDIGLLVSSSSDAPCRTVTSGGNTGGAACAHANC